MKRSDGIALFSLAFGIACGVGLRIWMDDLPTWTYFVVGAIFAGAANKGLLENAANRSVIESQTINRK